MAVLAFLGVGTRSRDARPGRRWAVAVDRGSRPLLLAGTLLTCGYIVLVHEALVTRAGAATALDLATGAVAILVVLELARRATGWGLVTVAALALAYATSGPHLPGFLAHRGYSARRIIEHLYLSTEGIWGVPLGVSADFVYLFVLFGAVLEAAGGGELLIGLSSRITGRTRGGTAKTAAIASAIMGSLSGSAVANVVTTGSLTIPVMKRAGFRPHFAGAIEAAASTGGQLMPPIMGAGAFILATWTNIPYFDVAAAAAIPAVLYYVALFMAIHFKARQMGLPPEPPQKILSVLPRIHLLLSLGVIVALLAMGRSPMRAAFWGAVSALVLTGLRQQTRLSFDALGHALLRAASGTVQVAAACAAAGIVVGVASLTGIGLRMSELIVTLSGGYLPLALILTALGSIVLGMGLPTTAAYVVLAALGAPALISLGTPVLAAHLFIFYFGCLSNVTPPVSLAAYAAAGIANAPPMKTAGTAMLLAGSGFIVPFGFVYAPALLAAAPLGDIVITASTTACGVAALAAATLGHALGPLRPLERLLVAMSALALIWPGPTTDLLGAGVLGLLILAHTRWKERG